MIEVHLYGKLRRFGAEQDARSDSIVEIPWREGDTVGAIVGRIGIPLEELGANLFRNGRYVTLDSPLADGDRLGLFPDDMQLLYKWYFSPCPSSAAPDLSAEDPAPSSGRSDSGSEADA